MSAKITQRFVSPEISEMNTRLAAKRTDGMIGIRLFVANSKDITSEDIAHDFNVMEAVRSGDTSKGHIVVTNFDKM